MLHNPYIRKRFQDEDEDDEVTLTSVDIICEAYSELPITGNQYITYEDARKSAEWPEWEKAIRAELDQLKNMGTWELVEKPPNAIPIANKWVLLKKYNKQGELVKYKARLVAKGCSQRPGYDYNETYSPVVRLETIRAILALVPSMGLQVRQMDVKGAYLNGMLDELVYMRQPQGYGDKTGRVCRLRKTLYGLKQSGRGWNIYFDGELRKLEFQPLISDPCAYVRRRGGDLEIVTVWVDDLLLFTNAEGVMVKLQHELKGIFDLTDLGEPNKIVGIEIALREGSLTISQKQYIENLLKVHGLENVTPVKAPMDSKLHLVPNPEGTNGNRSNAFASIIGSLQYLATATRPDIAYAVNRLSAFTANPSMVHYSAMKRILRYLAGTKDYGITYYGKPTYLQDKDFFYGYADASFANQDEGRSTSGYVFISFGGAITWGSKKQTVIALSTTEAEYVALSEAGREAVWLLGLYQELGFQQRAALLMGDNDGSLTLAVNPKFHRRTKHIQLRYHWIREKVRSGTIDLMDVRDPQNHADELTKALSPDKHERHANCMGLGHSA